MGSSLHPSYTQHTSGMIHATFRPERRRREGLYLPDVRRPTIPFCIFFVFLVFLKSLVLCDISCFAGAVLPPSQMALFSLYKIIEHTLDNADVFSFYLFVYQFY